MRTMLEIAASLRLTVALMAASMVLILAGTLAQVDEGVWTVVDLYFRSAAVWVPIRVFLPRTEDPIPGAFPWPGGLTLGALLLVNLLAAHAVRFTLSVRRTGIILTHLGVILLIVGEFVTGFAAEEGQMAIDEGGSSNYVEDIRAAELAIIDRSDPVEDGVTVVPGAWLARGGTISDPLLPLGVTVEEWMPNSEVGVPESPGATPQRADRGVGVRMVARPRAQATGVEAQQADIPSAYVTLTRGGERIGTFLVSAYFDEPEEFEVEGRPYAVHLRFKRTYKPYRVHLIDFTHERYVGTDRPKNFSSLVRLVDPSRHVDREVLIYMNSPLRYAGETFYQASFKRGDTGTVLQVVKNPGWVLPYASCAMVGVGLVVHFLMRLVPAARRAAA
jgi:hypothetical protein